MNLEHNESLPLDSNFAESLAIHTILSEACKILESDDSDPLDKIVAENTINRILSTLELPEE